MADTNSKGLGMVRQVNIDKSVIDKETRML